MEKFEFKKDDDIPINDIVNDENLLFLACETINQNLSEEFQDIAVGIISWYVLNKFKKENKTFTEKELCDEIDLLVANHILNSMVRKGLLEEELLDNKNGESIFKLSKKGEEISNILKGSDNE